ncbi:MAG: hypothetical protein IJY77_04455, partial [Alphaproteobacteria bacterium]|nr:hypothetical protein [Alphaproteobacteria bacterium]
VPWSPSPKKFKRIFRGPIRHGMTEFFAKNSVCTSCDKLLFIEIFAEIKTISYNGCVTMFFRDGVSKPVPLRPTRTKNIKTPGYMCQEGCDIYK